MKTLIEQLRASFALDQGGRPGPLHEMEPARQFEESLRAMDHELRKARAHPVVPPDLHASVMRAVQTSRREAEPAVTVFWLWRLAATALVLAIGVGVFWLENRPAIHVAEGVPTTETPPSFAVAFDRGHELTQAAPRAVLKPLAGEMELLDRDFQNAMSFLAANMP